MTCVTGFILLSYIHLFFSLGQENIFYATAFLFILSVATYVSADKIFSTSYVLKEVMPRRKREYIGTALIIVGMISGVYFTDSALEEKLRESDEEELRSLGIVLEAFALQTYAYKTLNIVFFVRYLIIYKKPAR